jgi:hypothetical protein
VGLVQCESNLLGIANGGGGSVGTGGWNNIVEKYLKAKTYCEHPFETRHEGGRKIVVPIKGEWIGERRNGKGSNDRWTLVETKVARVKELETQRNKHVQEGKPRYEVVACIDGQGFSPNVQRKHPNQG